jgi:hypothetical protein
MLDYEKLDVYQRAIERLSGKRAKPIEATGTRSHGARRWKLCR